MVAEGNAIYMTAGFLFASRALNTNMVALMTPLCTKESFPHVELLGHAGWQIANTVVAAFEEAERRR